MAEKDKVSENSSASSSNKKSKKYYASKTMKYIMISAVVLVIGTILVTFIIGIVTGLRDKTSQDATIANLKAKTGDTTSGDILNSSRELTTSEIEQYIDSEVGKVNNSNADTTSILHTDSAKLNSAISNCDFVKNSVVLENGILGITCTLEITSKMLSKDNLTKLAAEIFAVDSRFHYLHIKLNGTTAVFEDFRGDSGYLSSDFSSATTDASLTQVIKGQGFMVAQLAQTKSGVEVITITLSTKLSDYKLWDRIISLYEALGDLSSTSGKSYYVKCNNLQGISVYLTKISFNSYQSLLSNRSLTIKNILRMKYSLDYFNCDLTLHSELDNLYSCAVGKE